MVNPVDNFFDQSFTAPAVDGIAITPNDGANLPQAVRSIYVGVAGTVSLVTPRGTTLSFTAVAGGVIPFWAVKVNLTGTSASGLIGAI